MFDFVALFKKIVCVLIRFSHAGEKVLRAFHILLIVGFDLSGVVLFIFFIDIDVNFFRINDVYVLGLIGRLANHSYIQATKDLCHTNLFAA